MERRIRFSQQEVAERYRYPLDTTLLTATAEGAAETIGDVRSKALGVVSRLVVGNQTATSATFTLHCIPDGDTIGAGNREITALSIPGNTNADLTDLIGGLYAPGTVLKAYAETANALIVMGYVEGQL